MAPIDRRIQRRVAWLEALLLFLNAPFLLFPERFPAIASITLILLLVGWVLCWRFVDFPLRQAKFNIPFLLFAFTLLVAVLISADPDLTLPKLTGMILALAAWRYLAFHVNTTGKVWFAFIVFVVVGLGIIGLGVLSANWRLRVGFLENIFQLLPPQLVQLPGTVEAGGVHSNQLAGTLLFFITLPLAFMLDFKSFVKKRLVFFTAFAAMVFMGGLLILTQSRSAWLGGLVGGAFLVFTWLFLTVTRPERRRLILLFLALGLLATVILVVWSWPTLVAALYEDPPESTPIGTLQTLSFRYEVWEWAVAAIKDFPFTGTGLGTFRRVVLRLYPIVYNNDVAHAHNVFLQVALDVGLPGLISYISIMLLAAFESMRIARSSRQLRPIALGLMSSLVAFHVFGLTDTLALGSKSGIAMWLAIGLVFASGRIVELSAAEGSHASKVIV